MYLKELKSLWENDPAVEKVIEVESTEHQDGFIDYLFHILFKNRTTDYGRHAGLRVRVNRVLEVISHDVFNMTIDNNGNWVEAVRNWYATWSNNYSGASSTTGTSTLNIAGTVYTVTFS